MKLSDIKINSFVGYKDDQSDENEIEFYQVLSVQQANEITATIECIKTFELKTVNITNLIDLRDHGF